MTSAGIVKNAVGILHETTGQARDWPSNSGRPLWSSTAISAISSAGWLSPSLPLPPDRLLLLEIDA
jgi:hypothetical protein